MSLRKVLTFLVLLLVYNCNCYVHDERFVSSENLTIFEIFLKDLKLNKDLLVPSIDNAEADYIKLLGPKILQYQKPFALNSDAVSSRCRQDSLKFLSSLKKFDLWALKMYDASARLSSGVLNGNTNRYGDFDQCLSVVAENEDFQGQYCMAYIQPTVSSDFKYFNYLRSLMLALESYKSNLDDHRHVIPRTSQLNFAFCIPSTCSNKELEIVLKENLQSFFNSSNVLMDVRVEKEMCQIKEDKPYSLGTKLSLLLFGSIVAISIIAAFYDRSDSPNKILIIIFISFPDEWLTSFSLTKNWKELISTKASNDIACAHGIRFFNTLMLIISHKCMEIEFNPIPNRSELAEISKAPLTVIVRASYLFTDSFIMLSAMLVSYSFVGRLRRGQSINGLKEIAARYFRVVPPMTALIIFGTFIFPIIGSGPQWPMLVDNQSELCKKTWWRSFLMIHNWFGFENICMTHTHHVGTDFELFLTAPILVTLLYKYPKKTSIGIFILATLSTIARFYTTYVNDLTVYVLFGLE
ncbi:nose resistant to fluoxetine protein 6-like [Chironomus tepperi]|uniref:nose resistant to fluoxetine protein 6-like n=1 Tax=Chironomus tepperi TaxID=113505 RepID=UPI00391F417D